MTMLISPVADTRLDILEALDFPVNCQHSQHNKPGHQHSHHGPATHYVRSIHSCFGGAESMVYPACTPFSNYVASMYLLDWFCPGCGHVDQGRRMCYVIGLITN